MIQIVRLRIALLHYLDGEKRYILAPDGLVCRRDTGASLVLNLQMSELEMRFAA